MRPATRQHIVFYICETCVIIPRSRVQKHVITTRKTARFVNPPAARLVWTIIAIFIVIDTIIIVIIITLPNVYVSMI